MNHVQMLIKEICEEENIKFNLVSKNWIIILEKNHNTRYIVGYKFGLNDHALGEICDDKYAVYDVLSHLKIPVAEHFIVFKNYDRKSIKEYAKKYHNHLIIKTNNGTCGRNMYQVSTEKEMFEKIDILLNESSVSLSPFYDIKNEYRSIIYNNHIEVFYGKKKPVVVGDGKKSIYDLLYEFNPYYFKDQKKDASLLKILEKDQIYEYGWQHNLSKGAIPFEVEDSEVKQKVQQLALQVAKKLQIHFASIDIIELTSGEIMVLEINSGVMMDYYTTIMKDGRRIAKETYRKAILSLFEEK